MSDNFEQGLDILRFARKVIGSTKNIKINSRIFEHCSGWSDDDDDDLLNLSKDIIKIYGSEDKPIELNDLIVAFKKMESQMNKIKNSKFDGRSYYYEGFKYNNQTKMYEICWGS